MIVDSLQTVPTVPTVPTLLTLLTLSTYATHAFPRRSSAPPLLQAQSQPLSAAISRGVRW